MPPGVPRWLDDDERRTWIGFLYAQMLLMEQIEQDLQRDAGMPLAYYQILVTLSEHPDRAMRMSSLARSLFFSRSRLSHAVDRLERSGWVRRDTCAEDGRGAIAVLTDEGFATLEAAAPQHVESVRTHLFDRLTPEQVKEVREVSEVLVQHLLDSLKISASDVIPEAEYWHRDETVGR
jgi:DNA-binding MarR family transcriptional regulator